MAEAKTNALAIAIADVVHKKSDERHAAQELLLASIVQKLDLMQALVVSLAGEKRATRVASGKPATAKSATESKTATGTSKITNSLLFFRDALKNDLYGWREEYAGPDVRAAYAGEATLQKKNLATHPGEYYYALGAIIWKHMPKTEGQDIIRAKFEGWKEGKKTEEEIPHLEAAEPEAAGDDAAGEGETEGAAEEVTEE